MPFSLVSASYSSLLKTIAHRGQMKRNRALLLRSQFIESLR